LHLHRIVLAIPDRLEQHRGCRSAVLLEKRPAFLAGADGAGIVLGARVPIILTSRADSVLTRLASCAVASLVADARRRNAGAAIR